MNSNCKSEMENMYPEIYRELYPFVADGVDKLMGLGDRGVMPEMIDEMVDEIIIKNGLWDEDEESSKLKRGYHNRNTLRDLLKILALREIISGNYY